MAKTFHSDISGGFFWEIFGEELLRIFEGNAGKFLDKSLENALLEFFENCSTAAVQITSMKFSE